MSDNGIFILSMPHTMKASFQIIGVEGEIEAHRKMNTFLMERFLRTTGVGTERLEMEPSTRRPLALLLPGVEVRC